MADQTAPPVEGASHVGDDEHRFRRRAYAALWAVSLVVCPIATWVVGILSTQGPPPEGGPGKRVAVVDLGYLFGLHFLISCFAAWAALTVWGRWWLVGWGIVSLAFVFAMLVTAGVGLSIFYG
ncbi:hypothetical protein J0H58_28065 [bacterium]|nr:hypothetical protein [bacterium]